MTKPPTPPTDVYADPPRKHVMLLTCMDQRLLDDVVYFMNELNLHNRYDQVIFAGAAMGAARLASPLPTKPAPTDPAPADPAPADPAPAKPPPLFWRAVFFDHLVTAIDGLDRPIRDVFLLEHVDCGAYQKLYPLEKEREKYNLCHNVAGWKPFHKREAKKFAADVVAFCNDRPQERWREMRVWSLLMDLRGGVETLGCLISK